MRGKRILLFSKIAAAGALLLLALSPLAPASERGKRTRAPRTIPSPTMPRRCSRRGATPSATTRSAIRCSGAGSSASTRPSQQVSPRTALAVGLKVDSEALPPGSWPSSRAGPAPVASHGKAVDLDDPAVTAALLRLNAVVGVRGFFNPDGTLRGGRHHLCPVPFDGRRLGGAGDRQAARRLGRTGT